jgi:hypothetical protein
MRCGAAILFVFGFLTLATAQERSADNEAARASIGLQVGSNAPAFTSHDQFDQNQSNETLKASQGTILLFFRSADW